ncbi:MAG TPA: 4-hydroxybutyrate--acetyl-CoA CoA transferase, partial [Proteiniclasticum sp.]|nr:4-hydroxybutyrate--acetyl-CoA CoA transferase [Proteiniclasticum sp.]
MSYKEKVITLEQALDMIRPDMHVVTGLGAGEAQLIMNNIHTISDRVKNVTITNCLSMAHGDFLGEEYAESFNIDGWFFSPPLRKAFKNGNISFIPNHLHLAGWKRLDHVTPDIFVGTATMPDEHGFISLSTSNTYESQMIEKADVVILEINPNYPRTFGDVEIHYSEIDF